MPIHKLEAGHETAYPKFKTARDEAPAGPRTRVKPSLASEESRSRPPALYPVD